MRRLLPKYRKYRDDIIVHNRRLVILVLFCLISASCVLARLYYLQVMHHEQLAQRAWHNQNQTDSFPSMRGAIVDRNGEILAQDYVANELWFSPKRNHSHQETLPLLLTLIPSLKDDVEHAKKIMTRDHDYAPVLIKSNLDNQDIAIIKTNQVELKGLKINPYYRREYFHRPETGHIVGHLRETRSTASRNLAKSIYQRDALSGIEAFYNDQLAGVDGNRNFIVNAQQLTKGLIGQHPSTHGQRLQLTIDQRLQHKAYQLMADKKGAIVALNPNNGEILTLFSAPPAYTSTKDQPHSEFNRAIAGAYPLASTIKPYMALAGLNTEVISPEYQIYDQGWFEYGKDHHRFHDWRKEGHGIVDLHKAIVISSDVFFYKLALKLGIKRMIETLNTFGFGLLTGIDLPNEKPGLVGGPEWKKSHGKQWYAGDTIVAGIGQGSMLATPLQLVNAVAKMATHGHSYQPHLVKSTQDFSQPEININHPEHWDTINAAMRDVVAYGTGHKYIKDYHFSAAGKTGTAQVVSRHNAKIFGDEKKYKNHSLFIAYAPVESPKVALAIVVENEHSAVSLAFEYLEYFFELNPI